MYLTGFYQRGILSEKEKQPSPLNLSQKRISRIPDITNSSNLTKEEKISINKIDLDKNNITEFDFDFLINIFPNLQSISLRNNQINDIKSAVKTQSNKLLKLDLCKNKLVLQENTFLQFSVLTHLYLCENGIQQIPDKIFRGLERLTFLDLNNNKILSLNFLWFSDLKNLEELNLANNLILGWIPDDFLWQDKLHLLNLKGNQLKSLPPLPVREGWSANLQGNNIYCGCHLPSHENVPVNNKLLVNCSNEKKISLGYHGTLLHFVQQHTPICEKPSVKFVIRHVNSGFVMKCTGFGVPVPNQIGIKTTSGFIIKFVTPNVIPVLTLNGIKEEKSAKCTVRSLIGSISTKTRLEAVSSSPVDHGKTVSAHLIGLCIFTFLSLAINFAVSSVAFRKFSMNRPDSVDEETQI